MNYLIMSNNISIRKAILYTIMGKYSTIIMQTIFSMILSRILTPTEFGTVAVVSVFIAFFSILSDLGLSAGVIQNKQLSQEDTDNIFSVSVYMGIGLMLIFVLLSYPIAHLYEDKIYYKLCPILSVSVLINSFNMIPNAVMLKEKNFLSIAKRTFVSCLVSYSVSIGLALKGWGVYALCLSQVMSSLILFIWNELSVKLIFRFKPAMKPVRKIWKYSFFQFTSQTINFFCRSLDSFLIGVKFPKDQLAYYNKSYSLMMMPISNIPGVFNSVLHPILSEYQDKRQEIYVRYLQVVRLLSLLGCIISVVCFTFGKQIIYVMFGDQWNEAVLPFKILSLSIMPQFLTNTVGTVYQSTGETKKLFHSVCICTAVILISIIMGTLLGSIVTVATFVSGSYIINFFITFYLLLSRVFNLRFYSFIKELFPDFLYVIIVVFGVFMVELYTNSIINSVLLFVLSSIIYLTYKQRYKELIFLILKR